MKKTRSIGKYQVPILGYRLSWMNFMMMSENLGSKNVNQILVVTVTGKGNHPKIMHWPREWNAWEVLRLLVVLKKNSSITFVGGETTHLKKNVLVKLDHLRTDRAANEQKHLKPPRRSNDECFLGRGGCSCFTYDMFDGLLWPKAGKQEWNDKHPDENKSNNSNNNNNNNNNNTKNRTGHPLLIHLSLSTLIHQIVTTNQQSKVLPHQSWSVELVASGQPTPSTPWGFNCHGAPQDRGQPVVEPGPQI